MSNAGITVSAATIEDHGHPIVREKLLERLREPVLWDALIIGGGATGLGVAVDAASRGFRVALVEARDFASGTSSRSTKLVHGGVRYLAQGNIALVREALAERALLLKNAPDLVSPLEFVVPCYRPFEREYMRLGLGIYDALAGASGVGPTQWLTRQETLARLPGVRSDGLRGGVSYWDAQFDDARLAIALMRLSFEHGAVPINYVSAIALNASDNAQPVVQLRDELGGELLTVRAKLVFNASGVGVDHVRAMVDPAASALVKVSRGSHIVVDRKFLPAPTAMLIPRTHDGRVLFAIPWHEHVLIGTTDVPVSDVDWNPQPSEDELDFIIATANAYLAKPISRADIRARFSGLRPLFAPAAHQKTASISREHAVVTEHKLITVTGGKWTTYRRMAIDTIHAAVQAGLMEARPCKTAHLSVRDPAAALAKTIVRGERNDLSAFVRHAQLFEQAHSSEDVLFRRLRLGIVDSEAAATLSSMVDQRMQ